MEKFQHIPYKYPAQLLGKLNVKVTQVLLHTVSNFTATSLIFATGIDSETYVYKQCDFMNIIKLRPKDFGVV